tara:strand:- start:459 stop:659 length:201 start_codon:yes stop_codon:yes gene_type:complete
MLEITKAQFEADQDEWMNRIEKGEEVLIRMPDGNAVAALPVDEELEKFVDIMPQIGYDEGNPRKWR